MQRFLRRKLLFNAVLILSICDQILTMSFSFAGPVPVTPFLLRSHHRMTLDESSLDWNAFGVPTSHQKKFFTPRWTLSMDLMTCFMMDVSMTHKERLFVTCQKLFKLINWYGRKWVPFEHASIWHNLKHPTGSRRSHTFVTVYPFTGRYLSGGVIIMQGLLVFSFREGCHPMVDTRPPQTF